MKKILSLLFITVMCLSLVGCQSTETISYMKGDSLTVQATEDRDVVIPYDEVMTVNKKGTKAIGGSDTIVYYLTDEYFKDNEDAQKIMLENLASGLKQTYKDKNEKAVTISTSVKGDNKDELHVIVTVDFTELDSLNECVALFGLSESDFDNNQRADFDKIDSIMKQSGFEVMKQEG